MQVEKRRITILAIDDDRGDLMILRRLLERIPEWEVVLHLHSDPHAGVEAFAGLVCDVVILDYDLGPLNGLQVLERIRLTDTRVPVVLWTGRRDEETEVRARQAGVADYVRKNRVSRDLLRRTIAALLG